ncbi:MAG: nitroreductase family protein [Clostridiales bacterium]|nr:nitroreductase family protein [Clostridiales bacterium]
MIHNETIDNILNRCTIRQYTDEQLSDEEMQTLLECAMCAPSARNLQPCHVRAVQSKKFLDEMNSDFKNLVGWGTPAYTNWNKNPFYQNAPAVFFIYGSEDSYMHMDAGIMAENIALCAKSLGLGSCIIGSVGKLLDGEEGGKWKDRLDIPQEYRFLICVAVGHGCENPASKERKREQFKILDAEN